MASNKEFDYEPDFQIQYGSGKADKYENTDPVKTTANPSKLGLGGEPDPMRHFEDRYTPKHQTPERTSSQQ